jgi:hypothetical protein
MNASRVTIAEDMRKEESKTGKSPKDSTRILVVSFYPLQIPKWRGKVTKLYFS